MFSQLARLRLKIPFEYAQNTNYVVFHIRGDNTVEEILPTLKNNQLIFETSSFSYFIIAHAKTYTFTATATSGGSITAGESTADYSAGVSVVNNSQITLTAEPNTGYDFVGWYNGETLASSNTTHSFTITQDLVITAKFEAQKVEQYSFMATVNYTTKGSITEGGESADYTTGVTVNSGTQITLTADANSGYALKGWYEVSGSTETFITGKTTHTFTVNKNMNIKAVFDTECEIYVIAQPGTSGDIKIFANGEEREEHYENSFAKGTEVTLQFVVHEGWVFEGWEVNDASTSTYVLKATSDTYTFTVADGPVSCVATCTGIPTALQFGNTVSNYGYYMNYQSGCLEKTIKVNDVSEGAHTYKYIDFAVLAVFRPYPSTTTTPVTRVCYHVEDATTTDFPGDYCYTYDDSSFNPHKVGRYEIIFTYLGKYPPEEPVTMKIIFHVVE